MQDVTPRQRKTSKNKKEGLSFLRMMFYKRRKEKDQAEGLAFQSDDETAEEVTPPSVDNMNRVASVRPAHEESTTKRVSSVDGEDLSETQRDESEFKAEKWMPQKSFVSYIPDFPVHSSDGSDNERRVPSLSVTRLNTGDADRNNRLNVADGEPHRPRSPKPHSTRADQTEQIAQQRQRSRSSPKTLKLQLVKKEKSSTKLARNKSSLARTESFRIPRKQRCDALKDEHDDAFIRGVLYRGSGSKRVPILVKSKTPPVTGGDEVSPKKTILIETEKVRKPLVSDSDLSNTKKHQQHGILRSSNHRQNVGKPDASSLRRLSKQDLWNMAADVRETFERILPDNRESAGDRPTVRFQTNNCDRLSPDDICESSDSNGNIEVIKRDRQSSSSARQRPKSDLGGALLISDALKDHEFKESLLKGSSSQVSMVEYGLDGSRRYRDRRMSTPHPIKLRGEKRRPSQKRKQSLQRSCSAPDGINHAGKLILRKTSATLAALSTQVGELAVSQYNHTNFSSSDNDDSSSLDSESVISRRSSQSTFTNIEEIFDEDQLTFAEALWDHVTMDPDELPFRAGDVIEVTDMLDKDWWWGCVDDFEGWFPAAFVRLRVNQEETAEDFALKIRSGQMDSKTAMRRMSMSFVSKDQARSNVVNEIINAEREYVKHLKDVVQGYIVHARKRPEMFSPETLSLIFGNLEELYTLSQNFVKTLENAFNPLAPHTSQIGLCFLKHRKEFVIYSEYCNNHPAACAQLQELTKHSKYQQFFEACRLLQDMIEIPLEGFLLTPIQKICKYPLQLAELLKYTHASHPDYDDIQDALEAMKEIAALINERKRKLESIEKIALWQKTVQDWEGPDLLDTSSELIHQGDLSKVTLSSGWAKDRVFFLFDNQLVYCKKDLLKRNVLTFSGRLNINYCDIIDVADGKDSQFNLNARNAWKIYDRYSDKWLMMYAKSSTEKLRWLQAFKIERERVREDVKSGFNLTEQMKYTITHGYMRRIRPDKPATDKSRTPRKVSGMPFPYKHELLRDVPTPVSLPRATTNTANTELQSKHRRPWLIFGSKKATKR
ncbi:uncharacterized protein LOC141910991 [Tubulanus polymorphus]|uniref:uncharacterized protein LOC141910991 n=1 Tax=Tubulanus polymorphus TaxID=672921 RepID=UPI003DA471FD